jgi:hypothetical protein
MWRLSIVQTTHKDVLYEGNDKPEIEGFPTDYDPTFQISAGGNTYHINIAHVVYINIEEVDEVL